MACINAVDQKMRFLKNFSISISFITVGGIFWYLSLTQADLDVKILLLIGQGVSFALGALYVILLFLEVMKLQIGTKEHLIAIFLSLILASVFAELSVSIFIRQTETRTLLFSLCLTAIALGLTDAFVTTLRILGDKMRIRFHLKTAEKHELLREDEVLMDLTAFIQGILFIYLGLFQIKRWNNEPLFIFFTFAIPITGIMFYVIRALARIKDSNKLRIISFYFLFIMLSIDFSLVTPIHELSKIDLPTNMLILVQSFIIYIICLPIVLGILLLDRLETRYET